MCKVLSGEVEGGRCHYCGHNLKGLEKQGKCPECGTYYTEESASRLTPMPGAFVVCKRLGSPLFIVIGLYILMLFLGDEIDFIILLVGLPILLVVVPINGYLQVWAMLKEHLPEQKRTQGFIAGLRALGTFVVWFWVVFCAIPVILLVLYITCFNSFSRFQSIEVSRHDRVHKK